MSDGAPSSPGMNRFSVKFVGNNTTAEGHTVYHIKVTNPQGSSWTIFKRYREIRDLHDLLKFRHGDSLPAIPGKRIFGNQDPAFIASRQLGLQQYVEAVLRLDRDVRACPEIMAFLGGPPEHGERNQELQYKRILEDMQSRLLNLALPPAPLDDTEMSQRLKKYGQAMRLHVLSQPVDPIHLRAPGFDGEPLPLCSTNGERFEALQKPPSDGGDGPMLTDLLGQLHKALRPEEPIADPGKLIVPFPEISLPSPSGAVA